MRRLPPALLLTLALLALLVANSADFFFHTPYYESWDLAANSLSVGRAKHFAELYGPYSRWGFHHPGPAYFYALAVGEWLFHDGLRLTPAPYNAQVLTQLCISMAFFGATLSIFARRLPRRAGSWFWPLAVVMGAVHFGLASGLPSYDFVRGPSAFASTWSAHEIVLPLLCLMASGASVASGDGRDLPLLAVSAGTLLHLHVAQPIFVGPVMGLACLGLATSGRWRAFRGRSITAACILAVFLLPLALDLFRGADSNFAAIVRHLRTHHGEHKTFAKSLLYFLQFGTHDPYSPGRLDFGHFNGPGAWEYLRAHALVGAGWLLILILIAAIGLRPWLRVRSPRHAAPDGRGLGRFLSWTGGFLLTAIVLTLFWGTIQDGEMFYYNSWLNFAIYYFGLLIVITHFAASRAARLVPVGGGRLLLDVAERFAPAAVAAVLCLSAADRWRVRDAAPETTALLHESIRRVLASVPAGGDALLVFPPGEWPVAAAMGLEMARAGRSFAVDDRWTGVFGRDHAENRLSPDRLRAAVPWRLVQGPQAVSWRSDAPETLAPATRRLRERLAAGRGRPLPDDVSLTINLPVVEPGDGPPGEIDFRDGKALDYEAGGWSDAEPWGTWSDGHRSLLRFATAGRVADGGGVVLAIELHGFVHPAAGPVSQWFNVIFDGQPLGSRKIAGDARTAEWTLPAELWNRTVGRSGGTSLEFWLPDAASPAALDPTGRETDTRLLGIGVSRIRFRPAPPAR